MQTTMSENNVVLTIPEPGTVELKERPYPRIVPPYVLMKVAIAPICIEHQIYRDFTFEWHEDFEHMGHEGVGEVVETWEGSHFKPGDRVIIYQGDPCGECFVCTRSLSPTHCMNKPYEEMDAGATLHGVEDDGKGTAMMEAIAAMGVGMRSIELKCNSESGGFGFSRYRIAPESMLQKIPEDLDYRYAAAANCSAGCTYTGIEELGVGPGDHVLVAGIGFIGFGAIINAKFRGATVIALGRNEYRMQQAKSMGADYVLNPEDPDWLQQLCDITGYKQGVDYAAECSGYPFYQGRAIAAVRRYGGVFFFGFLPGSPEKLSVHVLDEIMNRHIFLTGGHDVRWQDREGLLNMLQDPLVQAAVDRMITHEFNMSDGKEAFDVALSKKAGKIYLYPWDDRSNSISAPNRS